ncbi:MAG: STAS domain-containing protein, partial [Pseudomonadales bacterium]
MSQQVEVSLAADNRISVRGCLDVESVGACKDAGVRLFDDLDEIVIDLGATEARGSAAVALLIAWQREAGKMGKPLLFRNAPEELLSIAQACGVRDIVPFEDADRAPGR